MVGALVVKIPRFSTFDDWLARTNTHRLRSNVEIGRTSRWSAVRVDRLLDVGGADRPTEFRIWILNWSLEARYSCNRLDTLTAGSLKQDGDDSEFMVILAFSPSRLIYKQTIELLNEIIVYFLRIIAVPSDWHSFEKVIVTIFVDHGEQRPCCSAIHSSQKHSHDTSHWRGSNASEIRMRAWPSFRYRYRLSICFLAVYILTLIYFHYVRFDPATLKAACKSNIQTFT